MSRLFDYPKAAVEADTSVIFCLDSELKITYCNPAWDQFALANSAPGLCRPAPIGRTVLDFIDGADQHYFEKHYRRALQQTEPWERDYECSSNDLHRKFRLRAIPMETVRGLFVINSLVIEQPHQLDSCTPLEELYRTRHGLIIMCSSCRRTRRNLLNPELWDWVPDFVQEFPVRTSHGICPPCRELYYPDDTE